MRKNEIDVDDLETAIQNTNEAIKEKPELKAELLELRKNLETMKIATIELANLRDDFERGNVVTESYQVQSKKLRMDIERARNEANLLNIIGKIKDKEEKSKLIRLKEAIVSNKDFIIATIKILKSILGSAPV